MTVYLFIFAILALITILMELRLTRSARLSLICLAYLILVLFVGLRWETGNDWTSYYSYYQHLTSLQSESSNFEFGYRVFSLVIKSLGFSYSVFLILYGFVYLGFIFLSFVDAGTELTGWIVLGFYSTFILGLMGTTREVMALAICLFSVRYVLAREWARFLFCIAVATTFHISALCFLLAWPVARIHLSIKYVWIILLGLVIISTIGIGPSILEQVGVITYNIPYVYKIADLNANIDTHEQIAVSGDPATRLFVRQFSYLIVFILCARYIKSEREWLYFKLYLVSIAIILLIYHADAVIAMRLAGYFSVFEIYLFALFTRRINPPALRILYCVLLIALFLHGIWTGVSSTSPLIFEPYKGIFINQDVTRLPGWF